MTQMRLESIQPGWKVFVGSDEVGEVVDVRGRHIDVRRGSFIKHEYRVPEAYIAEAADGVVDLRVDRQTVEALEHARDAAHDDASDIDRAEHGEDVERQPADTGPFAT